MMSTFTARISGVSIASHMLQSSVTSQVGDAKLARSPHERLWVFNASTPQRLRLLFLVNRSTHSAHETNGPGSHRCHMCDCCHTSHYVYHMNKSHRTSVVQNIHVDQKTACAVLLRSVARLSSLFPPPTFSVVENESCTSWSMCADCTLRLLASVVCSSEISTSDFSVALRYLLATSQDAFACICVPNFVQLVFVLLQHILILLCKELKLLRIELLLNHPI